MNPDSVPLDPATCLALKPIHDIGNQAMRERDAWNRWSVEIARMLHVSCSDFASDVVAEQYAELRDRITQAMNVRMNDGGRQAVALRDATNLIGEIMRDEVNAQDECEKWLRAYCPNAYAQTPRAQDER